MPVAAVSVNTAARHLLRLEQDIADRSLKGNTPALASLLEQVCQLVTTIRYNLTPEQIREIQITGSSSRQLALVAVLQVTQITDFAARLPD